MLTSIYIKFPSFHSSLRTWRDAYSSRIIKQCLSSIIIIGSFAIFAMFFCSSLATSSLNMQNLRHFLQLCQNSLATTPSAMPFLSVSVHFSCHCIDVTEHLQNLVSASWLWKLCWGFKVDQKQKKFWIDYKLLLTAAYKAPQRISPPRSYRPIYL